LASIAREASSVGAWRLLAVDPDDDLDEEEDDDEGPAEAPAG
jgi:hypothetical protein